VKRNKCCWFVWWKYKAGRRFPSPGVNHSGTTEKSLFR
jgi:hypothetical protein